ncbi:MAG: DUF748 domain-containing protein [Pseudomonadota bacterium]
MRTFFRVAVIAYAVYLAIALLIISPALNYFPHRYIEDNYGWDLQTKWVVLNPFKLSLDISEFDLTDDNGEPFLKFNDATVNLSTTSIWRTGWVLDKVGLQNLFLNLKRIDDEQYNFSSLLPPTDEGNGAAETAGEIERESASENTEAAEKESATSTTPELEEKGAPGLTIKELDIHSESIVLSDLARPMPYESKWDGLHVRATEISTVLDDGKPYSIDLKGDGGGTLRWEGQVSIPKANSQGKLTISDLNLRKLWEFASPFLSFELTQGALSIGGNYDIDWSDALQYAITNGRFGLSNVEIVPQEGENLSQTSVILPAFNVNNISVDSDNQQATIDEIIIDSIALAGWMEEDTISLVEMFVPSPTTPSTNAPDSADGATSTSETKEETTGETEQTVANREQSESAWTVRVLKTQLNQGEVKWRSDFTDPKDLKLQPIDATVQNFTWPFAGSTDVSLALSMNDKTQFDVQGALETAKGAGELTYNLKDLHLATLNPNKPEAIMASIENGRLDVDGNITLSAFAPKSVALNAAVSNFAVMSEVDNAQVTGFDSVTFDGLNVDMDQRNMSLNTLAIGGLFGRIHIKQDGSINTSNIWQNPAVEETEKDADSRALAEEQTQEQTQPTASESSDANSDESNTADTAEEQQPWSFNVPTITIADSEIDFMDESLPLQFRTVIGDMQGEILNISSDPQSSATVDIKGAVDKYAPVSLAGQLSPFGDPLALDLNLNFNSVDMATLSPYSGTYAGHVINRGLLNLDLEYKLDNNQLQGNNALLIDKLQLGEKIDSDKAVDLPLELALAILTDANGVIDMQVPVSGDVNDPSFGIGSVVVKAFFNVITKVITSPFSLLASLAGSDEDLQNINFPPGSVELSEQARNSLNSLADAMAQRPKLSLLVTGQLNLQADRDQLQQDVLETQLIEAGLTEEEINTRGQNWERAISTRYSSLESNEERSEPSEPTESSEPSEPTEPSESPAPPSIQNQYTAVYSAIEIPDEELTALAQQRAIAAKTYLVNEAGLSPERAVVAQASLDDTKNSFSGVELGIEN